MDVRQLAALVAIADHGSFSAAARALLTVQSNVSAHLSKLELELGVTLVDRGRSELTDEGRLVVERARRVLREMDDITADVAALGDEVVGETRLGVLGTTARWLIPDVLSALGRDHPRAHTTVVEGNTSTLVPRVLDGQLDAAVVHLPVTEPELVVEALFAEDLVLAVHCSHRFAGRAEISLAEVAGEPLLLPPKGTTMRRILDRAAASIDVTFTPQAEVDGVRLLASLTYVGHGLAFVPATAYTQWTGSVRAVVVPELPRRVVGWVQRRRPVPGAPTRAAAHALREAVVRRGAEQPGVYVGADAFPLTRGV